MAALLPPDRPTRDAFPVLARYATRWRDNDAFSHLNNVVHYEYFDSAVNRWLIEDARLDVLGGPLMGLVGETACRYFAQLAYPAPVEVGLRAARVGTSSVTYALALFGAGPDAAPEAAAVCRYVHVYVDRATGRPTPLPENFRAALARIG